MRTSNLLKFRRLGLDTQQEYIAFMREDCHVCISEGFSALTRIQVSNGKKSIVASLNVVRTDIIHPGEISLSESAAKALAVKDGSLLTVSHHGPIASLSHVRSKVFGNSLSESQMNEVITDIVGGNYSNIQLSAFITACAGDRMTLDEIKFLTNAMIKTGKRINWGQGMVVDKHCVGGLPGNRTTPVIVSIVAAFGLIMPKTSSRAITSPAGTADTMEVMTNVNLTLDDMIDVVNDQGACLTWGSLAGLSPADDILIRVEKALDLDSEGQLIASVLSKKVAAGATHVIIDIPVGPTAKIRSREAADSLKQGFEKIGTLIGLKVKGVVTDGSQPVGNGIGPALEARDVLDVLRNEAHAPDDLRERSIVLAGELLELSGEVGKGDGYSMAGSILRSGKAWDKFYSICLAQGGFREPGAAEFRYDVKAERSGNIAAVDNRMLAMVAKLAGAPEDKTAGVLLKIKLGSGVEKDQTLFEIHSESEGELAYAVSYLEREASGVIKIE